LRLEGPVHTVRRPSGGDHDLTNTEAPKSTDITDDQTYLDMVACELNNRPRPILGYRTPAEVFADLLASSIATTG
jgi:hypothetical protein